MQKSAERYTLKEIEEAQKCVVKFYDREPIPFLTKNVRACVCEMLAFPREMSISIEDSPLTHLPYKKNWLAQWFTYPHLNGDDLDKFKDSIWDPQSVEALLCHPLLREETLLEIFYQMKTEGAFVPKNTGHAALAKAAKALLPFYDLERVQFFKKARELETLGKKFIEIFEVLALDREKSLEAGYFMGEKDYEDILKSVQALVQ